MAIQKLSSGVQKALGIARDVAGGTKDYVRENKAVHQEALNIVGAEQQQRIRNVGQYGSPTPYGTNEFYGEFLINAQGEDVVAGVRTPEPVLKLKDQMPKSYAELLKVRATLDEAVKTLAKQTREESRGTPPAAKTA